MQAASQNTARSCPEASAGKKLVDGFKALIPAPQDMAPAQYHGWIRFAAVVQAKATSKRRANVIGRWNLALAVGGYADELMQISNVQPCFVFGSQGLVMLAMREAVRMPSVPGNVGEQDAVKIQELLAALEARSQAAAASEAAAGAEAGQAAAGRAAFQGAARELAALQQDRRDLAARWRDTTDALAK